MHPSPPAPVPRDHSARASSPPIHPRPTTTSSAIIPCRFALRASAGYFGSTRWTSNFCITSAGTCACGFSAAAVCGVLQSRLQLFPTPIPAPPEHGRTADSNTRTKENRPPIPDRSRSPSAALRLLEGLPDAPRWHRHSWSPARQRSDSALISALRFRLFGPIPDRRALVRRQSHKLEPACGACPDTARSPASATEPVTGDSCTSIATASPGTNSCASIAAIPRSHTFTERPGTVSGIPDRSTVTSSAACSGNRGTRLRDGPLQPASAAQTPFSPFLANLSFPF